MATGFGYQGPEVTDLQKFLNQNGSNVAVDGLYGPETHNALMELNRAAGVDPTAVSIGAGSSANPAMMPKAGNQNPPITITDPGFTTPTPNLIPLPQVRPDPTTPVAPVLTDNGVTDNTVTPLPRVIVDPTAPPVKNKIDPTTGLPFVPDPNAPVVAPVTETPPTTPPTTLPAPETPAPVEGANTTDPTKPFVYDPSTDTALQAALREKNRAIQNAMNRRGIFGSGIMQQELSTADTSLIDTYSQLAKQKYDQVVSDHQKKMDLAYENAVRRGYYNNEEAALWGVPPGTKIGGSSSSGGGGGIITEPVKTGDSELQYDKLGNVKLTAKQKAFLTDFKSFVREDLVTAMSWLNEQNASDDLRAYYLSQVPLSTAQRTEIGATIGASEFGRIMNSNDKGVFPTNFGNRMWAVYALWNNPLLTQSQKTAVLNKYPAALEMLNTVLDLTEGQDRIYTTPADFKAYLNKYSWANGNNASVGGSTRPNIPDFVGA